MSANIKVIRHDRFVEIIGSDDNKLVVSVIRLTWVQDCINLIVELADASGIDLEKIPNPVKKRRGRSSFVSKGRIND